MEYLGSDPALNLSANWKPGETVQGTNLPAALYKIYGSDPMAQAAYKNLLGAMVNPMPSKYGQNRAIVDRSREYQATRDANAGRYAAAGLQGAGVAKAADASLAGNAARDADVIRRRWASETERRRREAMKAYSNMVLFPQMDAAQREQSQKLRDEMGRLTGEQERWEQWSQLAGALGSVAGGVKSEYPDWYKR